MMTFQHPSFLLAFALFVGILLGVLSVLVYLSTVQRLSRAKFDFMMSEAEFPIFIKTNTELAQLLRQIGNRATVVWHGFEESGKVVGWTISSPECRSISITPVIEYGGKNYDSRKQYGRSSPVPIETIGDLRRAIAGLPLEMPVSAQLLARDDTAWYMRMTVSPQAIGMSRTIVTLSHEDLHTLS